ncbi:5322_t:CDS:1, partial [Ambispora leptoticha]
LTNDNDNINNGNNINTGTNNLDEENNINNIWLEDDNDDEIIEIRGLNHSLEQNELKEEA